MANIALTRRYATLADYWTDVQAFMISAGWTLHDDVSADNKVYKTNGIAGAYPYIYVELTKDTTGVHMELWLYWNATTHVGTAKAYSSTSYNYCNWGATRDMALIGNANFVALHQYTDTYGCLAGFLDEIFYSETTTTSGAITAGSSVDIPVADSSYIMEGQFVQIVGVDYEGREKLIVTNVPDPYTITVDNLLVDYAAGAFVGAVPCPAGITGYATNNRFQLLCYILSTGTAVSVNSHYGNLSSPMSYSHYDPDQSVNFYGLATPHVIYSANSLIGVMNNDLIKYCSSAIENDVFAVVDPGNQPEQGAVSSSTSTTLTDTTKTWAVNSLIGRHVVILDGTGVGQSRKILSNTSDTITVVEWLSNPSITSIYRFCDKVYRYWSTNMCFLQDREVL